MTSAIFFSFVGAGGGFLIAAMAAAQSPRSVPRWAFVACLAVLSLESTLVGVGLLTNDALELRRWEQWRMLALAGAPFAFLLFSWTYARAAGEHRRAQYRAPLVIAALLPVAGVAVMPPLFGPALPQDELHVLRLLWPALALQAAVLTAALVALVNLERTFRASVGTARWRIKYVLLGVAVVLSVRLYTSTQMLAFRGTDAQLDAVNGGALLVATPLLFRGLRRAGHFDLDVYPSGPVLRNSLTILIAGIYLLCVGLLAKLVSFLGGNAAFSVKAFVVLVAFVALAITLQSDKVRLHSRQFVSRHFHRPLHDYGQVWRRCTKVTTTRVERTPLCSALAALLADVFQVLSVRVWLCDDDQTALEMAAATTRTPDAQPSRRVPVAGLRERFARDASPIDLETVDAPWSATLREMHPCEFSTGGHRICAPLIGRGDLLGVITLGDRVGGVPFQTEDLDLLRCITEDAAGNLLNVRLAEKLLQARQLEAFQSMAAFFIHDLKNAASTLNLTLKNLPTHFEDPEFRADALRALGKTTAHLNQIVGRLTALRQELQLSRRSADLNEIVRRVLASFERIPGLKIVTDLQPLPELPLDRDQMEKVVTNLVLNATEAVAEHGEVRVQTARQNGGVVLTVGDDGCGMTPEFVAHSLFRPFQTTKASGLGIGMFQSKMIVEAHGGHIAVSSEPGHGSRFQIFLTRQSEDA